MIPHSESMATLSTMLSSQLPDIGAVPVAPEALREVQVYDVLHGTLDRHTFVPLPNCERWPKTSTMAGAVR